MISASRKEEDVPTSTGKVSFGEKSGNYPSPALTGLTSGVKWCPLLRQSNMPQGTEMAHVCTAARSCSTCDDLLIFLFSFTAGRVLQQPREKRGRKVCSIDRSNLAQAEDQVLFVLPWSDFMPAMIRNKFSKLKPVQMRPSWGSPYSEFPFCLQNGICHQEPLLTDIAKPEASLHSFRC